MPGRELSPVGESDLSSNHGERGGVGGNTSFGSLHEDTGESTSSNTPRGGTNHSPHNAHRGGFRPTAGHPTTVLNDSFGQPLGNNTIFGSTRPFESPHVTTEVERFLSRPPPLTNQTFGPGMLSGDGDGLQVRENSSFVSIPQTMVSSSADVSSRSSPRIGAPVPPITAQQRHQQPPTFSISSSTTSGTTSAVQQPLRRHDSQPGTPAITVGGSVTSATTQRPHTASPVRLSPMPSALATPLTAQSKPPVPTVIRSSTVAGRMERPPAVLVASDTAGGTGNFVSTSISGGGGSALQRTQPRPPSPGANAFNTGPSYSSKSHPSDLPGSAPLAGSTHSPLLYTSAAPAWTTQSSTHGMPLTNNQGGRPPSPGAIAAAALTFAGKSGLALSRSEGELSRAFGGAANMDPPPPQLGAIPLYIQRAGSPSGSGRRSPSRSTGMGGVGSVSATSRQRGVVRATEVSSALGGTYNSSRQSPSNHSGGTNGSTSRQKPRWLSAVERTKVNDVTEACALNEPLLPYDQSRLGMQTRQAAQQGTLTAGKLRALESAHLGNTRNSDRSALQPLVAYSNSGGRPGSVQARAGYHSPSSLGPAHYPALVAQEETLQSGARHYRTISEASGRRGGIRARSVSPMSGGRHVVAARGYLSAGGGVITATETGGGHMGGALPDADFVNRSENGGLPNSSYGSSNSRFGGTGHKLANFFHNHNAGAAGGRPVLRASDLAACEVVTATGLATLRASDEQRPYAVPSNGGGTARGENRAPSRGGGGGGDGGSSCGKGGTGTGGGGSHNRRGSGKRPKDSGGGPTQSREVREAIDAEGDEDERDERNYRTRNTNAMHAIPWEQRRQLPMAGFGTRFFALLSTPRFWEKLDWAVRGALLTVLPTMVLSLEPNTQGQFPMASSLAFTAFWITMPTFGGGLRELVVALKGFTLGLVLLMVLIGIQPGPPWLIILLLFLFTLLSSFIGEVSKKTAAYVLASTFMTYLNDHTGTDMYYVGQYYESLLISLAFGTAAFLIPFVRWSSDITRHYIKAMSNSLSINLQGTVSSFWVRTPLERELNVLRLHQLHTTSEKCIDKIETALDESGYEPHTGAYLATMSVRFNFCKAIHNIIGSLSHVIERIAENPSCVDTPMCVAFGEQIRDDLAVIASAMDSMVLKICDFHRRVTPEEIQFFREARERFQDAVSRVREDVILNNENYETDESDILLGFFMFSVDEMCEVISQFEEVSNPPNTFLEALKFPIRDIQSVIDAFKNLVRTVWRRRVIPRRMKEAVKLAVCMSLPCIFQVYALDNDSVSPMAGASVIAFIYNPTGSESFHYASGRLLGTVLGSLASLLSVQIADGRRGVLYVFIALLSFIGAYVQAAPGFYALGNAIVCSTISITTQYTNQSAAMVRIQQNCFAVLMYFAVVSILWPMRARTKVKVSLDFALRCTREAVTRMLRNLDMPEDAGEVSADVSALLLEMVKKVGTQGRFIPGAGEEPTMGSVEYPVDAWKRIVHAERKLWLILSMMRFAYRTFMSSSADSTTELSVHWVVLHRISPHAMDLSDLVYATIDLHLLSLNNTTVVPTSHLTRLRVGMVEASQAIEDTYIRTIARKVAGEDTDDDNDDNSGGSFGSSYVDEEYMNHSGSTGTGGGHLPPTDPGRDTARRDGNGQQPHTPGVEANHTHKTREGDTERPQKDDDKKNQTQRKGHAASSAAASDHGDDGDDDHHGATQRRRTTGKEGDTEKKKTGYLGYTLSGDEAAALRNFVANRVLNNGTFAFNNSMVGNTTFANKSMLGATAAGAAGAALARGGTGVPMAGSPPVVNNDARLMAMRGGDDGLAAAMRKKHGVVTKKEEAEKEAAKEAEQKKNDGEGVDLDNLHLNNASFFKNNSFLLNKSFLGSLFARKTKETHDLDKDGDQEMQKRRRQQHSPSVSSSTPADPRSRYGAPDDGSDDDNDDHHSGHQRKTVRRPPRARSALPGVEGGSERSTPSTSPTRHRAAGPLGNDATVSSEFSDIEDDHPRHREVTTAPNTDATKSKKDGKSNGRPPMAKSSPTTFGEKESLVIPVNPFKDGNAAASAQASAQPKMATSSPASMPTGGNELPGTVVTAATTPLLEAPGGHSAEQEVAVFSSTPVDTQRTHEEGMPELTHCQPTTGQHEEAAVSGVAAVGAELEGSAGSTPEDHHTAKKSDSHDSTRHTGETEGKMLSGNSGGSSQVKGGLRSSDVSDGQAKLDKAPKISLHQSPAEPPARLPSFTPTSGSPGLPVGNGARGNASGSLSQRLNRRSNNSGERTAELLRSMAGNTDDDGRELLRNISFFNPEKGEFVLTNHDVHSLEAFLFGVHALVSSINELQKAILEMQHESELAKRL